MKKSLAIASLALLAAAPAGAQTYNVVSNFGAAPFSYGFGAGSTSFQSATFNSTCFGNASLSCYANNSNSVPTVLKNNSDSAQTFGTPTVPTDMLLLHPGFDANSDAELRFTSFNGGNYSLDGAFMRLDTSSGSGNGVNVSIFSLNNGISSTLYSGVIGSSDYGSNPFNSLVTLGAGGQLVFAVNNAGDVSYDSTGLSASISAVPEPATWALMMVGFGMIGFGLRRRSKITTSVRFA